MADGTPSLLGTGVDIGGALAAGNVRSAAAGNALAAQTQAAQQGNILLQQAYDRSAGLSQPYVTTGAQALPQAYNVAQQVAQPYSYQQYLQSGDYQAQLAAQQEAANQLNAQAVAQGLYGSGTTANALAKQYQQNAAKYYDQARNADLNRQMAAYNMYGGLGNIGASAASGLGSLGYDIALGQSQNLTNIGAYAAQAAQQKADIFGNTVGTITKGLSDYLGSMGGARNIPITSETPADQQYSLDQWAQNAGYDNFDAYQAQQQANLEAANYPLYYSDTNNWA